MLVLTTLTPAMHNGDPIPVKEARKYVLKIRLSIYKSDFFIFVRFSQKMTGAFLCYKFLPQNSYICLNFQKKKNFSKKYLTNENKMI